MLDSKGLIYVPKTIRIVALLILGVTLALGVFGTFYFLAIDDPASPRFTDWALLGMSLVHLTLSGLAVALVLFYSERELDTKALNVKLEEFLDRHLPAALSRISPSYESRERGSSVRRLGHSDIFGAAYELSSGSQMLKLWVGLNVSRIFVILWLDAQGDSIDELKRRFEFTFGGAEKVGYHTFYEPAQVSEGVSVVSIWSTVETGKNLLAQPSDRLFWVQDVAMMVESFWRTAIRHGLATSKHDPSPL